MTLLEIFEYTARDALRDRPIASDILGDIRTQYRTNVIFRHLDEAQDQIARQTHCIEDEDTDTISEYALTDGEPDITLHPSVIMFKDNAVPYLRLGDGERKNIYKLGHRPYWDYDEDDVPIYYKIRKINRTKVVTFYPAPKIEPTDSMVFNCPVIRYPLIRFSPQPGELPNEENTRLDLECEIDESYQQGLAYYVLYSLLIHRKLDRSGEKERDELWMRWNNVIYDINADVHRETNTYAPVVAAPWF